MNEEMLTVIEECREAFNVIDCSITFEQYLLSIREGRCPVSMFESRFCDNFDDNPCEGCNIDIEDYNIAEYLEGKHMCGFCDNMTNGEIQSTGDCWNCTTWKEANDKVREEYCGNCTIGDELCDECSAPQCPTKELEDLHAPLWKFFDSDILKEYLNTLTNLRIVEIADGLYL